MIQKISFICILIVTLFSLTGCYNNLDIEKYFYIVGLGLDSGENGLLKVSVQIANTLLTNSSSSSSSGSGNAQASEYRIYSAEAETIDSAITILNNYLNKKINLSHCTVLVISEDLCKKRYKRIYFYISK